MLTGEPRTSQSSKGGWRMVRITVTIEMSVTSLITVVMITTVAIVSAMR
jgi:hypothetical protein